MEQLNLKAKEILTFIPSGKRYKEAIRFYLEIGFELVWESEEMCLLKRDGCRFFLQNYKNEWAHDNFMMVLEVENLADWWTNLSSLNLPDRYNGVKLKAPEKYPWGKEEIHLIDPCGVLWHISVDAVD